MVEQIKALAEQRKLFPLVPITNNVNMPYCPWSDEQYWIRSTEGINSGLFHWVNQKGESKKGRITGYSLLTGERSGITVIDLDIGHQDEVDGVKSFEELLEQIPGVDRETVKSTFTVQTPRGGKQLYFKYVEGIKTTSAYFGDEYPGIDTRNDGGQVPIPYSKRKLDDKMGNYSILNEAEIQEMPETLADLFLDVARAPAIDRFELFDEENFFEPLRGMVEGEGRNEALNKALFQYAKQHGTKDLLSLKALAKMVNEEYFAEPEEGAMKTAESVYRKMNRDIEESKREVKLMPLGSSLRVSPVKRYGFLVNRLIYDDGINLISGDPKTYKTFAAAEIAAGIASGTEALSHKVMKRGKVLFISTEFDVRNRLVDIMRGKDITGSLDDALNNIITFMYDSLDTFQWKKDFKQLEKTIAEHRPKLVVLDPLTYIFDGDINKNDEVGEFFKELKALIRQYGFAALIVHHNNRMNETKRMNNVSGSSAITRFCDSIIYLERFKEDEEQDISASDDELDNSAKHIKVIKGPYRHGGEGYKYYDVSFDISQDAVNINTVRHDMKNDFNATGSKPKPKAVGEYIEDCIVDAVRHGKLKREGFSFSDVRAVLENVSGNSESYYEKKVREILGRLVKDGELSRISRGYKYEGL